jgi:hypothetical protein
MQNFNLFKNDKKDFFEYQNKNQRSSHHQNYEPIMYQQSEYINNNQIESNVDINEEENEIIVNNHNSNVNVFEKEKIIRSLEIEINLAKLRGERINSKIEISK